MSRFFADSGERGQEFSLILASKVKIFRGFWRARPRFFAELASKVKIFREAGEQDQDFLLSWRARSTFFAKLASKINMD